MARSDQVKALLRSHREGDEHDHGTDGEPEAVGLGGVDDRADDERSGDGTDVAHHLERRDHRPFTAAARDVADHRGRPGAQEGRPRAQHGHGSEVRPEAAGQGEGQEADARDPRPEHERDPPAPGVGGAAGSREQRRLHRCRGERAVPGPGWVQAEAVDDEQRDDGRAQPERGEAAAEVDREGGDIGAVAQCLARLSEFPRDQIAATLARK